MSFRAASIVTVGLTLSALLCWPIAAERLARHFEDQLRLETGLDWRIGSIKFAWLPSLLLTDVATAGPKVSLSVGRLTVPLSRALITGSMGTVPLRSERVNLRIPIDGDRTFLPATAEARPSRLAMFLNAIHARLLGVDLSISGDGRHIELSATTAEIDLDVDPSAVAPAINLTVEDASQRLRIELDRPESDAARNMRLDFSGVSTSSNMPTVRMSASVKAGPDQVSVNRITGTLSQSPVSGSMRLVLTNTPFLTADFHLDDMTMKAARDDTLPGTARGPSIPVPTSMLPRPSWFSKFDADLRITIGRVALGPALFEDLTVGATIREGTLETAINVARAYESAIKLRYTLSRDSGKSTQDNARGEQDSEIGRHRLSVTLAGARLRPFLADLIGVDALDARARARIDLQATAARPADVPGKATGFADVTLTEGRVDSTELIGIGGDGPFSRFQTLGGSFSIAEGRAVTNDLELKSSLIQATGAGSIDLISRTLDLLFRPSVTSQRGRSGAGRALNVPIHVSGPWNGPAVSTDIAGLLQNPMETIDALQDLGTGLVGQQEGRPGTGGFKSMLDAILPRGGRETVPVPRR